MKHLLLQNNFCTEMITLFKSLVFLLMAVYYKRLLKLQILLLHSCSGAHMMAPRSTGSLFSYL